MTLSAALTSLYQRLGYQSTPAADVTARLTGFLNSSQQDVIGEIGGRRLAHGTITFASVASQAEYGLLPSVARILSIRDTANNRRLQEIPESTYRTMLPSTSSSTGTPYAYSLLGLGSVQLRPSSSTALVVISTSAADTTQTAQIDITDGNGRRFNASVALNGLVAATIASSVMDIHDYYLSAVPTGVVELRQTNGTGAVMSAIQPGHLRETFQRIGLVTTPSGALTYTVDCEYDITDLINATDSFPVPERFTTAVLDRAMTYEFLKQGDQTRYAIAMSEYRRTLGKLNHYLVSGPDQLYIPGGGIQSPSILPGNWPWDGYGVR